MYDVYNLVVLILFDSIVYISYNRNSIKETLELKFMGSLYKVESNNLLNI